MIYLFALFLMTSTTDQADPRWHNGIYTEATFTFETIVACEAHRLYMIRTVKNNNNPKSKIVSARISKCAAAKDTVEYNTFAPNPPKPTDPDDLKGDKS